MTLLIISIVLLIIAGIGKAVMDTLQFHFSTSVFWKYRDNYWIDPAISWRSKYKNHNPSQGERFPGSTTIFIFVTDLWHFSQFLFLRTILFVPIFYALSFNANTNIASLLGLHDWIGFIVDYLIFSVIFGLTFTLFYSKLLKKWANRKMPS